jgi:hypothetical protein
MVSSGFALRRVNLDAPSNHHGCSLNLNNFILFEMRLARISMTDARAESDHSGSYPAALK